MRPLSCWILILSFSMQAQKVKHQSEIIRARASKGDYHIIADLYNSHRGVVNISEIKKDRNQPDEHFELFLRKYPNHPKASNRKVIHQYFPDHIAFPVTYLASTFEGNKKLQEAVGYVVREGRSVGNDRIVFVEDYMFMLQNWKNKNQYEIRWVLKAAQVNAKVSTSKTRNKKGFFGALKNKLKKETSMNGGDINSLKKEILQPYLDKATEQQENYYANWIKNPENAKTKKYIDDQRMMMEKAIRQYNDDIYNSPEYQRMLAYRRWLDNNINMIVHNKSGRTLWIGSSSEAFITQKISSGESATHTCTSDLYYYLSDTKRTKGTKFYQSESACGASVIIR